MKKEAALMAFDEIVLFLNATDIKGECLESVKILHQYLHEEENA